MDDQTPEIRIIINPDGTSVITAVGFVDQACREATYPYEKALGSIISDTPTTDIAVETSRVYNQEKVVRKS